MAGKLGWWDDTGRHGGLAIDILAVFRAGGIKWGGGIRITVDVGFVPPLPVFIPGNNLHIFVSQEE